MGHHVGKAEKERGRCEDTLARWQAESAAKRAELADLESRLGGDVLADESAAVRLTRQVTDLRAAVDTADRTAAAPRKGSRRPTSTSTGPAPWTCGNRRPTYVNRRLPAPK